MIAQEKDKRRGLDGVSVRGNLDLSSSRAYEFSFWSPNKQTQPRDFAIADAVFSLLESTAPSCELNEYLEWLAIYFSFGLPARVTSGPLFSIRFYGALSTNEKSELERLVVSLPTDRPIMIDMTNFSRMGTLLYPQFQLLLSRVASVSWLASPEAAQQLVELGVKPETIDVRA